MARKGVGTHKYLGCSPKACSPADFDAFLTIARRHGVQEFSIGDIRATLYPMIAKTEPRPGEDHGAHRDRVLFHSAK